MTIATGFGDSSARCSSVQIPDSRVSYYLRTLTCDLTNSCDACIRASVERSWNNKRRSHVNVVGSTFVGLVQDGSPDRACSDSGPLPGLPHRRRRRPARPRLAPRRGEMTKRAAFLGPLLLLFALVSVAHGQDGPSDAATAQNAAQAFGLYLDSVLNSGGEPNFTKPPA